MNIETVKEYYGKVLQKSSDLKTGTCCTNVPMPAHARALLDNVHDEVRARYYGCGLILPERLRGCRVLDLGCGSGRDAYLLAQLVGEEGEVVGIDMTEEQLAVARSHLDWHRQRFGYRRSNVRFVDGYIEKLDAVGLEPASFDVIVSNCVINLSIDKPAVFAGALGLLKDGGEVYFSDVYADRRLPDRVREDKVLYGECLGGALYWEDFRSMVVQVGFAPVREVTGRILGVEGEIADKLGETVFRSVTSRLFRIGGRDERPEDYGQLAVYRGGMEGARHVFEFDRRHRFERGRPTPVCRNTATILRTSRFADAFEIIGDGATHFGGFPARAGQA